MLETAECEDIALVRGVAVPGDIRFRQILVTGIPGSGKSTLVRRLGGWPEEGFLDLAQEDWWRGRMLTFRPREVHLGFPVAGCRHSLAVTDREWLEGYPPTVLERIRVPPARRGWFSVDWRNRYAFDFQLIPAETIYGIRVARGRAGTHPLDAQVTLDQVHRQMHAYQEVALYLCRAGVPVYVREEFAGKPRHIVRRGGDDLDRP